MRSVIALVISCALAVSSGPAAHPTTAAVILPRGGSGSVPAAGDATTGTLVWQRVPTAVAIAGGRTPGLRLVDIAATPTGLVAVGRDDRAGVIATSPDGIRWTRIPDSASFDAASPAAIAVGRRQMLAVGTVLGSTRGLLWRTADGVTWTGPLAAFVGNVAAVDIAVGPPAWVVAGSMKLAADARGVRRVVGTIWRSTDGRAWERLRLPDAAFSGDYRLTAVAWLGSRFVALGRRASGLGPEVLVWTSTDGRSWRRGGDIPVARDGEITDLALAPGGRIVAVGAQGWTPTVGASFTSADGTSWVRASAGDQFDGAVPRGVACDATRCVAVGETRSVTVQPWWGTFGGEAVTWTSPDGRAWTRVATTSGDAPGPGSVGRDPGIGMERVVRTGEGLVAVGWATVPVGQTAYLDRAATWATPATTLPPAVAPPAVPTIGGRWEPLPPLTTPRFQPAAAVGPDGRIYVFGGTTRAGGSRVNAQLASVEVFDPATRAWGGGVPIPGPLAIRAAAVTARDGRIFLFHRTSSRVLIFDPARGTWSTGPAVPAGRWVGSAILGSDGLITVATSGGVTANRYYALDPATGRWTSGGPTAGIVPLLWANGLHVYGLAGIRAWEVDPSTGTNRPRAATPPATSLTWGAAGLGALIWTRGIEHRDPPGYAESTSPILLAYEPRTNRWFVGPPPPAGSASATTAVAVGDRLYLVGSPSTSTAGSAWVVIPDATQSP